MEIAGAKHRWVYSRKIVCFKQLRSQRKEGKVPLIMPKRRSPRREPRGKVQKPIQMRRNDLPIPFSSFAKSKGLV